MKVGDRVKVINDAVTPSLLGKKGEIIGIPHKHGYKYKVLFHFDNFKMEYFYRAEELKKIGPEAGDRGMSKLRSPINYTIPDCYHLGQYHAAEGREQRPWHVWSERQREAYAKGYNDHHQNQNQKGELH